MNAKDQYEIWLDRLPENDPMHKELLSIADDDEEINDHFYQEIVFGTAGLRGICGAGTNRMNRLTVGRATQGIANYILASGEDPERGVVIAYDCRYHSREFSELAAEILAGSGIRSYLFEDMRPTPELSYAIRRLGAVSGINMTASHNPKEYNGYKVYWADGAQISGTVSDGILREIQKLDLFDTFTRLPLDKAIEKGLVTMIGAEMDREYLDYVKSLSQRGASELDRSIRVVYTPLNGAGSIPVSTVMDEMGYTNFWLVPEQKDPDPEFSTVGYPNPEDPRGFALAEKLGTEKSAEVLIATDPDSDRMAVEIPDGKGGFIALNGNQTGALLIHYMAQSQKEKGTLPAKSAMIKSIVTSEMGQAICEAYGIRVFNALTGFKNICGVIPVAQEMGYSYFFGYEESIGCAPGVEVRDKDGVSATMLVTEMAAWYKKQGMTIAQGLEELYRKYGYFSESPVSLVLEGMSGSERIGRIMKAFRDDKPQSFGNLKVHRTIDYINGYEDVPASNVLRFDMDNNCWFAMRPSGTEPKIKFYFYSLSGDSAVSAAAVRELKENVMAVVNTIE